MRGGGSEEAERRRAAHEAGMNVADAMNGEDVSVEAVVDAALDAYARPALRAAHPEVDRGHKHQWVDVRNAAVESGEMCVVPGCGAVRTAHPEADRAPEDEEHDQ